MHMRRAQLHCARRRRTIAHVGDGMGIVLSCMCAVPCVGVPVCRVRATNQTEVTCSCTSGSGIRRQTHCIGTSYHHTRTSGVPPGETSRSSWASDRFRPCAHADSPPRAPARLGATEDLLSDPGGASLDVLIMRSARTRIILPEISGLLCSSTLSGGLGGGGSSSMSYLAA